jgi:LmeA-like phospholipid-binding
VKGSSVPWLVPGVLLLAVTVILVGIYAFLPSFLEGAVARGVQDRLGLAQTPDVELEADSPPEMLAARFTGGEISLHGADLGDARAEQVTLELDPFDLDVLRSLSAGAPRAEEPLSGTLRATLSEGEVLRVVRAGADVPVRDLQLEGGQMIVGSEASVLGLTVPVTVRGDLVLRGQSLVFEPQEVSALGSEVPPEVAQGMLAGTDLSFPLEGLPAGAEVQGVEVREGRLVVTGRMERIPLQGG